MTKDRDPNDDPNDEKCSVNPDNASHNLDARIDDQRQKPSRDVAEADFAAEAHGFTAFENTGQGSSYRGGALNKNGDDKKDEGKDDAD